MKRTFTLMIAIFAVLVLGTAAFATHVFPDVADDNTHSNSIEWASDSGVVVGYENGNFGPEDNITRGQAASMFYNYNDTLEDIAGPQGPAGPSGSDGSDGADGSDGVNGFADIYTAKATSDIVALDPGEEGTATSICDEGYVAIGGGHKIDGNPGKSFEVIRSQPTGTYENAMFNSWEVVVDNTGAVAIDVQVAIVCADVTPAS